MSSLSSYLASKYLTADPKPSSRKRKRKDKSSASSGLIIADDTDDLRASSHHNAASDDEDPLIANSRSAEFRKKKSSSWKTVGVAAPTDTSQREADAIIASAAAENRARGDDDDAPVVQQDGDEDVVMMGDGTHAGLQSAAAVKAQMEKRRAAELANWEREEAERKRKGGAEEETVYRDATGKRIDIALKRAELRKAEAEAKEKERKALEELKGEKQLEEARRRREELDEARFMPLARTRDDEEMNRELKERERWNDPAAPFLSPKEKGGGSRAGGGSLKPVYKGPVPPNRYGIRPGHRWDGVDRGNGWESERFKAANRKTARRDLEYQWQMDE